MPQTCSDISHTPGGDGAEVNFKLSDNTIQSLKLYIKFISGFKQRDSLNLFLALPSATPPTA
jgi:hypothetical protein